MTHEKRKRVYIDPQVQRALSLRLVIRWTLFIAIAMFVAICIQFLENPMLSLTEHAKQAWWIHGPFFLILIALIPVFVRNSIKLSNRFAGPIYRMRKTIRIIAEGKPAPRLKFRDDDYWQELAEEFNTMVQRLSQGTDIPKAPQQEAANQENALKPTAVG